MYISPNRRAAATYGAVGAQSSIDGADPHRLIELLFDGLLDAVNAARGAMARGDVATKGAQVLRAVRILEEGLAGGLNDSQGGDLAVKLRSLYYYCVGRLTFANLRNDADALTEVVTLITPVAQSWKEIGRNAVTGQPG